MDRTYLFTYIVPVIGAFVLAAGIGGAVLGAYAPLQQDSGLCGESELTVFPPGDTGPVTGGSDVFSTFAFGELTPEEQRGFREALRSVNNAAEIPSDTEHAESFRTGAVVSYQGNEYYVATTLHECTNVDPLVLPLSFLGLVLGTIGMLTPIAWRRRIGRPLHGGDTGGERSALAMFRDGPYEGIGLLGSFGAAVPISIVPLIGPLLGGSIVGAVAPTTKRAAVLGIYLGVLVAGILALSTAVGVLPNTLAILSRVIVSLVPAVSPTPLAVTAVVTIAPLVLAPLSAVATRWGTRSF